MSAQFFKKATTLCVLTVLIFWVGKLYSYDNALPIDGALTYGFPLTYYEMGSGMDQDVNFEDLGHTDYGKLTIDVLFALATAGIIIWLFIALKKKLR